MDAFLTVNGPVEKDLAKDLSSPAVSSLEVHLEELNQRSQFFMTQFWQVPFAYVGFTAVFVMQVYEKAPKLGRFAAAFSAIIGIFVILHMYLMHTGNIRATYNLRLTEKALKLDKIDGMVLAKYLNIPSKLPMFLIPIITIFAYTSMYFVDVAPYIASPSKP